VTSQLFAQASEIGPVKEEKRFGHPYRGRYHMPLLPGEEGVKSGGDWVPGGLMRMTNLVGAFEDTRALSIWEQAMGLIGLALSPELHEELVLIVHQARSAGVNFELLREHPDLRDLLAGKPHDQSSQEASIIGRAKTVAKAHAAAVKGTNRHLAWEHRGATGELIGTAAVQESTLSIERLLTENYLVRMPGFSERVVRNLALRAVGKIDDVVMEVKTGRMMIADLKTKQRPFYSFATVDAQEAGYAKAEWMLTEDCQGYEPGPLHYVNQTEGVILHVPSDGSRPHLDPADLEGGWQSALLAAQVVRRRAEGRNVARMSLAGCVQ
jgi:hypothetical protein